MQATRLRMICPKCGKEGTQEIFSTHKKYPNIKYLRIVHENKERHFIGRVKTTDEMMNELNEPQTLEECQRSVEAISKGIRNLIGSYSPKTAVRMNVIGPKLIEILEKHGY